MKPVLLFFVAVGAWGQLVPPGGGAAGGATSANQTNGTQKTQVVGAGGDVAVVDGTGALKVAATISTAGLATEAKQDTGNTSLSSLDGKSPALGQALAAASIPVVLTAAQVATLTPPAAITGFSTEATLSTLNGKIPSLVSGRIPVDGSGVTQPVSGTFWQATQPVSGTVTVTDGAGALNVIVDSSPDLAQNGSLSNGNLTNTFVVGDGVSAVALRISGTWVGTVDFQGSVDATTWDPIYGVRAGVGIPYTQITEALNDNIFRFTTAGFAQVRAVFTRTSGTVTVAWRASQNVSGVYLNFPLPPGANNIGDMDVASIAAGDNNIGNVDVVTLPSVTIGTFPDNEPFNVAQINGVTPLMGAGNTGTGSLRVTIATDQAAIATMGNGATGAAPPANAQLQGGLGSGATSGLMIAPTVCDQWVAINGTASADLVTGVSGRRIYICSGNIQMNGGANTISFVSGTGTVCATSIEAVPGFDGATTAANGYSFAANSGMTWAGANGAAFARTTTTGENLCILIGSATRVVGGLSYAIY